MSRCGVLALLVSSLLPLVALATEPVATTVARITRTAQQETDQVRRDADIAAQSEHEKILKSLKEVQDRMTRQALLDEAVAIRDFCKAVQSVGDATSRRLAMEASVTKLPREAQDLVSEHLNESRKSSQDVEVRIREILADKNARLEPLFEKATNAGDLDGALAVREAMSGKAPAATNPVSTFDPLPVVKFSNDPQMARAQYQEQIRRLIAQENEQLGKLVNQALPDFQSAMTKETRAGELDTAVKIRNLLKELASQPSPFAQVQLIRNSQASLVGSAAEAALKVIREATTISEKRTEQSRVVGQLFATALEPEIGRLMRQGEDPHQIRMILHEYYGAKSEAGTLFSLSRTDDLSSLSDVALEHLNRFGEQSQERVERGRESERQARVKLVESLQKIQQTDANAETHRQAIARLIEFANEDFTQGLFGLLLFPSSDALPEEAREAMSEYRGEVRSIQAEIRKAQEESLKVFKIDMKQVFEEQIAAGAFLDVYKLRLRLEKMDRIDDSLPIKVAHSPFSDRLSDAELLEVRGGNSFLIRYGMNKSEEWVPRTRIKFHPDDKIVAANLADSQTVDGPGIRLDPTTKVKRGQKAFKYWGSSWRPVTIQSAVPEGISFTWDNWSNRSETCPRSELRLLED